MNSYWDLIERERSELTAEDVEGFVAVELMHAGVVRARRPKLVEVAEPQLKTVTLYALGEIGYASTPDYVFSSESAARSAAEHMYIVRSDYRAGSVCYFDEIPKGVRSIELPTKETAEEHRAALARAQEAKRANEKALEQYEKASAAEAEALASMWRDWRAMQAKGERLRCVADTLAEYLRLAGDERVAVTFLRKVFTGDEIDEAKAWFGLVFADPDAPVAPEAAS